MGGKTATISNSEQRLLSLQVQQSSQGLTLPVVYGRTRIVGNLIWYGDFAALEHKTVTRSGKGGGGVKQVDIKYDYEAAVALALCEGEIQGVTAVWRDKEKFTRLADLGLTLQNGSRNQPVWGHLQTKHPDQALSYSDTAYVYGATYRLTKSAQIHSHNFEVAGKLAYSEHIPDANPRDVLVDLLTNPNYGCGFPAENLADTDVYSTYCRALGLFVSPAYAEQNEAQQVLSELLEQTHSAAVFSEGRLKIIPYGDAPASGNGAVYVPNLTPIYDLTDDDYIVSGADDPVRCERKAAADAYNQVQIEYLDRSNDYNIAVAEAKDQANIEKYGLRPKDAVKMHAVCDKAVAQRIAQLLLQRGLYVRNEYEFKLGWKYVLLEPMDLVTLTDAGLGLDKTPVRIIEIDEDADGMLTVRAEDFPFGVASATTYPTQGNDGYAADYNVAPQNTYAPAIFEAPLQLTNGEPQIWLAASGGEHWGGCEVWVSGDGDSYVRAGSIHQKARYGSLTALLPADAVYDNANGAAVQLLSGSLQGVSENDAQDMLSACLVGNEFLAFADAELTGVGQYRLSKLVRGAWGSAPESHAAGTRFVRVDDALFRHPFSPKQMGKTVYIKLISFNIFGAALQDLSEVPAYPYTIVGAPLGQVSNLRLTSEWAWGKQCALAWDKLDGADSYDVEVYAANSQNRLRLINGVVDNRYTYTLADMQADGGQVRDVVFKVRGRALTGKTGKWTQLVARNPQLKALQGIELESGLKQAFFKCAAPQENDFAGILLWVSEQADCPAVPENLAYDGADTFVVISKCKGQPLHGGKTYYVRAAGYDSFDKQQLNISSSHAFTVYEVNAIAKELSESNLAGSLKERIGKIDGNGAGSVNARIAEEAEARAAAVRIAIASAAQTARQELTAQVAKLTAKDGELKQAQTALDGKAAELTRTAQQLGNRITAAETVNREQATAIQTVTAAHGRTAAALETEKTARAQGDAAEARAREDLAATVGQNTAALTAERQARIDADAVSTRELTAAKARLGTAESNIGELRQTVSTQNSATTARLDNLTAHISNDPDNLCRNPSLADNANGWSGMQREYVDGRWVGLMSVRDHLYGDAVHANGGDVFFVAAWLKNKDAVNDARIGIWSVNSNQTQTWQVAAKVAVGSADEWVYAGGYVAVPTGFASARLWVSINKRWNAAGGWFIRDIEFRRVNAVQAAITAEREARVAADNAHTAEINTAKSQISSHTAQISRLQSTKADQSSVVATARTGLQAEWQRDAQSKANAAKSAAIADAAAKDAVVKREAAADAQRKADAVKQMANAAKADIASLRNTVAANHRAQSERADTLTARLDNLQVGGRNYVLASGRSTANYLAFSVSPDLTADKLRGQTLTVSCDIVCQDVQAGGKNRIGAELAVEYADGTSAYIGAWRTNAHTAGNFRGRISGSLKLADKPVRSVASMGIYNQTGGGTVTVARPKLEIGSVATDWSPATEDGATAAQIQSLQNALAEKDRAHAQQSQTVQTALSGIRSSVQTAATSINGLKAQYTVKVDTNGHVAGYGLASEPVNGQPRSKFIVQADRFGIGATGKSTAYPFVVDSRSNTVGVDGALVVNGKAIVDRLYAGDISGEKIAANSITANHLQARSINSDKLAVTSLSAISSNLGTVTAGSLNIGNGRFVVNSDGEVTIRSAVGGRNIGFQIVGGRAVVFDELGQMQVCMGLRPGLTP